MRKHRIRNLDMRRADGKTTARFRIGAHRAPSGMTSETSNQIAARRRGRGAVLAERLDDVAAD
ncbi:MAG TPA: hypothetical protein VIJ35_29550, partial [Bradyrhizobium sp.]